MDSINIENTVLERTPSRKWKETHKMRKNLQIILIRSFYLKYIKNYYN
jgi:hypothetical protein